ncbi:hypothetical protein FQR65_LT13542 [Abscondita terminalis]|nr:hypothetical protein FQR65_LT13542 [Abscondita terminalis]
MIIESETLLYTLLYLLMCGCIVYPPVEFISSGITISSIFSFLLGSENEQFILYHIKRSIITLFVYSFLPLGYAIGLWFFNYKEILLWSEKSLFWSLLISSSIVLPLLALYQIKTWADNNWEFHPIVVNIKKFCNNNSDWNAVASDINIEFRRIDKISIQANAISKVIATENWIMKVTPLTIFIAHQSDTTLNVNNCDTHFLSPENSGQVQYVTIEVKSSRDNVQPFNIRLNSLDFKDLQDRIARPITILPNVSIHKTLMDKFVDTFKEVVQENQSYSTDQEIENCIGCLQKPANVKLQKLCGEGADQEACATCYCRPMWCIDCMAKWFASRQDSDRPDTWLSSKCTCPMCRARFCLLDSRFIYSIYCVILFLNDVCCQLLTTLAPCDEDQLLSYLAKIQVLNPETIINLSTIDELPALCDRVEESLTDLDAYLRTCLPSQKDLYIKLLQGVDTLYTMICTKNFFADDFRNYYNCYHQISEALLKCNGPDDWNEREDNKVICEYYKY